MGAFQVAKISTPATDKKPTSETVIEIIFRDASVKKPGNAVLLCNSALIRSAKRSGITTKAIAGPDIFSVKIPVKPYDNMNSSDFIPLSHLETVNKVQKERRKPRYRLRQQFRSRWQSAAAGACAGSIAASCQSCSDQ